MRIACPGPSGETDPLLRPDAISRAVFLNRPGAGFVESVFTFADHRRLGGVVERLPDPVADDFLADLRVAIVSVASVTVCDAIHTSRGSTLSAAARRRRKNSLSIALHSDDSTPSSMTMRWLSEG